MQMPMKVQLNNLSFQFLPADENLQAVFYCLVYLAYNLFKRQEIWYTGRNETARSILLWILKCRK